MFCGVRARERGKPVRTLQGIDRYLRCGAVLVKAALALFKVFGFCEK